MKSIIIIKGSRVYVVALAFVIVFVTSWVIFQKVKFQISSEEPIIRAGANIKQSLSVNEVSFDFTDPLKTPDSIPVYPIQKAPDALFTEDAVVTIAANTGFTNKASAQLTTEGYIYNEKGSTLSFNVTGGTITYSVPRENLPVASQTISITEALSKAKDFVARIGFTNPLYMWSEENILLYTINGDNIVDATFVDNKTQYHITIPMQIGNAPLYLPQQQYVRVHANGDIVGAALWYPSIDLAKRENVEVIDYVDATSKTRVGDILYQVGSYSLKTELTASTIGYSVPDRFFYQADQGGFITEPVYIFSNDDVTVYVDAQP